MFGLVIPLLFGIAVDLFVFMPIRSFNLESGLVIYVSQVKGKKNYRTHMSIHGFYLLLELVVWCCIYEHHS